MAAKKGGLGRGLDSLFNENAADSGSVVNVRLTDIEPNRNQPRKIFDEEALQELADSISKHGLIQPIVVRPEANGTYRIIAGERRWRACRMAGLSEVPVAIKEIDDRQLCEMALIENLQREDLNAVEEAKGYKALMDTYGLTQEQVAESVGKSRSAIANTLRLLNLNDNELEALENNKITAGHARVLITVEDSDLRTALFNAAISGASVRELERAAAKKPQAPKKTEKKDTFFSEAEISLKTELGRRVKITQKGKNSGLLTLEFFSRDELTDFIERLAGDK